MEEEKEDFPQKMEKKLLEIVLDFIDSGKNIIGVFLIIGGLGFMVFKEYFRGLSFLLIGILFLFIKLSKLVNLNTIKRDK